MVEYIRFLYVVLCFAVCVGSYALCRDKRDWAWLAGAIAFTCWADFFLVLRDAHVMGVAVFCFAHVCYAMRVYRLPRNHVAYVFAFIGCTVVVFSFLHAIAVLAGLYAFLFIMNMGLHVRYRKTLRNAPLILAGLILFLLCDVSVLLYNIPRYLNGWVGLKKLYPLIWWFYIPSQGLLAVSAIDFKRLKRSLSHG